jgi:hypothetical protein
MRTTQEIYARISEHAAKLAGFAKIAAAGPNDEAEYFINRHNQAIEVLILLIGKNADSLEIFLQREEQAAHEAAEGGRGHMLMFTKMRIEAIKWVLGR